MAEIGSTLNGKYVIEKLIGKGGMSRVYLARDIRLKKRWAIKEIDKRGRDPKMNKLVAGSAVLEADIMKDFDNYYLPRVSDILDNGKNIFIVMDYIEGESLKSKLAREGAQPQGKVLAWAGQIARALYYLHSLKPPVIYRDTKPGNIMIKPDDDTKLIDFGIARRKGTASEEPGLGTRGYAAPEQFTAGAHTDERTDIYNLGATLYHALTGQDPSKPPYAIKPIRAWDHQLSPALEKVIVKCTEESPARRYQHMPALIKDIDRLKIHGLNAAANPDEDDDETTILSEYFPEVAVAESVVTATETAEVTEVATTIGPGVKVGTGKAIEETETPAIADVPEEQSAPAVAHNENKTSDGYSDDSKKKRIGIALGCVAAVVVIFIAAFSSPPSDEGAHVQTTPDPPDKVANLSATATSMSDIVVAWAPSDRATGYEVCIAPVETGDFVSAGGGFELGGKFINSEPQIVTETSCVESGLVWGEPYIISVSAIMEVAGQVLRQEGGDTVVTVGAITLAPEIAPPIITAKRASPSYSSVKVSWDKIDYAGVPAAYTLYRASSEDGLTDKINSGKPLKELGDKSVYTNKKLKAKATYWYKVAATYIIDGKTYTAWSDAVKVKTKAKPAPEQATTPAPRRTTSAPSGSGSGSSDPTYSW